MTVDTDIQALRMRLLSSRLDGTIAPSARITPRESGPATAPLSAGQRRLWFLDSVRPGRSDYLIPIVVRLRGAVDADALCRAWFQILRRHEVLRTRYRLQGAEPVQEVLDARPHAWTRADLRALAPADRRAGAGELVERLAREPMSLADGSVARAGLVTLADDRHELVLCVHHIAFDAWSESILWRDLARAYRAETGDSSTILAEADPGPHVQYADYARWQRSRLDGDDFAESLEYWCRRLTGLTPLDLPAGGFRPVAGSAGGGTVPLEVPAPVADAVRELAARRGTTPFVVLLTAFQALLSRYTGRRDIALGVPMAGRDEPEAVDLIGFFVNTVVVRTAWTGDPTFGELIDENRELVLEALEHQQVPFERIVERLSPDRDVDGTPLVQVMFGYQDGDAGDIELPGVEAERVPVYAEGAKFNLNLQILSNGERGMNGALEFSAELFDEASVRRMIRHYLELLRNATRDPGARLRDVPYLAGTEVAELLRIADGGTAARDPRSVHELISEHARSRPHATAVRDDRTSVTFGELDVAANRLAGHLRAIGVEPGSIVGVHLPRNPELVAALLAVLKIGAAYVPLDPGDSATRRADVLADAGARIVVTDEGGAAALGSGLEERTAVLVDRDADAIAGQPDTAPAVPADPDALAYVIYTSGTTGRPKGVMVTHRGLMNYLWWTVDAYLRAEGGGVLFSSIAFDLGVPNLYTPLICGRPVHVLPDVPAADLGARLLECGPLSFVKMAPGHLELIAQQLGPEQRRAVAGLVIAAGDRFTSNLANDWLADSGPGRLAAEYGPTEITVGNSGCALETPVSTELVSIGAPIPNTSAYVLDDKLRPVPVGFAGEVYVGGAGVARGYLNQPALTADRFVPDPFAAAAGARLYRTGDLAVLLPGGDLQFVGRVDQQIKIRGYRVEPAEVQNVLLTHPAVQSAVLVARRAAPGGGHELVAYLVPATDLPAPDAPTLRAFVRERLPEYMVPSAFVVLETLPLTDIGKVDLAALPEPGRSAWAVDARLTAPRTAAEEEVAEVWRSVLGRSEIGVHDSFFAVGGDSVRAVALVGMLRGKGFEVTVRDVFEQRTIAALATLLGPRSDQPIDAPLVRPFALLDAADRDRLPAGVADAYPLSRIQLGMVLEMQGSGAEGNYHNITSYLIKDPRPYRQDLLQAAIDSLVARHEVLRTAMDLTNYSEPLQMVLESAALPVGMVDLRQLEPAQQETALRGYMAAERGRLFDLSAPPLFRFFVHVREDGWWFTFTEFHPILEGWSFHVLLTEVLEHYHALCDGIEYAPNPLPAVRYADFIALERREMHSAEHAAFWQDVVTQYPKLELPAAWGGEPGRVEQSLAYYHDLEDGLRELARRADASMKSVMLAAHLRVMSMLTPEPAFAAGLVCDTRPEVDGADHVPGMYLNTLPFPFRRGAPTWRELVRQVFETEIKIWPHRRYPLGDINRADRSGRPIDVDFAYLDFHVLDWDLVDQSAGIDDSPNEFRLQVTAHTGCLSMAARPQDLSGASLRTLGRLYRTVLEAMAEDPDGDARQAFTPVEFRSLAEHPRPRGHDESSIQWLVEQQAARTPEAPAVIYDDQEVSYEQLNARANQLAHRLAALGVGPESIVAVHLERSVELVVALLAVLKAGGAFLPLDPEHPREWRRSALAQAAPSAVITTGRWLSDIDDGAVPCVCLDRDQADLSAQPDDDPAGRWRGGDQLAYVIFTSGSTGRPKGAQNTHRGLVNRLRWGQAEIPLDAGDAVLQKTPISFDVSLWELFWPLTAGARLVLARPGGHREPQYLADLVASRRVSVMQFVPSMLAIFLDTRGVAERCRDVRHVVCSGEALSPELQQRTLRDLPWIRLHNLYGPAETAIEVTAWECLVEESRRNVPIGLPIWHTRTMVCDTDLNLVPYGVVGELCLAGDPIGRGYHHAPALTADRFVPDPSGVPGERVYRTGDLARMAPDGVLDYLGRCDRQIKLHGVRIEPGQIEAVLVEHATVRDAAVVVDTTAGEPRLVAYVVPDGTVAGAVREALLDPAGSHPATPDGAGWNEAGALAEELRRWCRGRLPAAQVPGLVIPVAEFPVSRNGKLDRAALPAPPGPAAESSLAPRSRGELDLLRIWRRILDKESIGVEDDFFGAGGNSLLGVRLVAAINRELGASLPVSSLFEDSTVAAQAAGMAAARPQPARTLVLLRPGSGRPTFCIAPMGGTVFCYLDLARALPGDGPVYGLQSAGLEPGEQPHTDLTEIAAAHCSAARAVQPDEPWRLIGWSFGAVVAREMARQRIADGDAVELLAMLDPSVPPALEPVAPQFTPGDAADEPALIAAYLAYLKELHQVNVVLDSDTLAAMPPAARRRELLARMQGARLLPADAGAGEGMRLFEVYAANWRAHRNYRPGSYSGPLRLFTARSTGAASPWLRPELGGTAAVPLVGDHFQAVRPPNIATVAKSLTAILTG
jgi:amino acid adenylation domain-containing protein